LERTNRRERREKIKIKSLRDLCGLGGKKSENNTYILEVYEDWSGFIGSTVVIIAPADFQTGFAG
jgi:hypothetical protein